MIAADLFANRLEKPRFLFLRRWKDFFEMIVGVVVFFVSAVIVFLLYFIYDKIQRKQIQYQAKIEPFVVSEYYGRMEKVTLEILEAREPVNKTITLWWGLDGLRLNEDGTSKWISREKPKPVLENPVFQNCQFVPIYNPDLLAQTQSTRESIDALMKQNISLQMQALQEQQRMQLVNSLQQCCVQYPSQYPPYFYGGCCGNYLG